MHKGDFLNTAANLYSDAKQHSLITIQPIEVGSQSVSLRQQPREIQFILVQSGHITICAPGTQVQADAGNAVFFANSCAETNCSAAEQDIPASLLRIKFSPDVICSASEPDLRARYLEPILYATQTQTIPLLNEDWQQEICSLLWRLAKLYRQKKCGYELRAKMVMLKIWMVLYDHVQHEPQMPVAISYSYKMRSELLHDFIHQNYTEHITLDDIAASAHISRGECCRIFKKLHRITPFHYLIQYRLRQSIKLLSETDASISEIAQQVGFGSSSYYTECFKKEMNTTPLKYRQQMHHASADPDSGLPFID